MKRAYENCDILTFVSVYEGFGMPIIEANTIGRVVLTGNIAAMPEVANDAALMVNPLDIEAIRKGILKLINDKNYRNQLIENGFENAKRFDVKVVTGQYYSLYKEVYSNFET
jgi:glycosyltransferase involved in cell wall biosynthesis